MDKFRKTCQKLDSMRMLVQNLFQDKKSSDYVIDEEDIPAFTDDFEKGMNNDLDLTTTFDRLHSNLVVLNKMNKGRLSEEELSTTKSKLIKIDYVLQVLF